MLTEDEGVIWSRSETQHPLHTAAGLRSHSALVQTEIGFMPWQIRIK